MRIVWIFLPGLLAAPPLPGGPADFFETRIRPLLANKCFACHTDAKLGGLRLDSRDAIVRGGKTGPAIVPGKPEESLLIQAVSRRHERLKMPPTDPLAEPEVADLAAWVKMGAVWPSTPATDAPKAGGYVISPEKRAFWSFQPIRKPGLPAVKNTGWARNAIDRFVLAKLEQKGIAPIEEADRTTLIRRATFDLTGLPPAPEEVDAFVSDPSPGAFDKVVSRLLESPRYGERWGRYWLDFARYADGALGASKDTPYENAYRYRNWVIASLNQDLPYNRMLEAQIAADLFEESDKHKYLPGLGFQALGGDTHERLDVTTKTFLGLTVGCAQCHDHKFDPIPAADYYSLYGVLASLSGSSCIGVADEQVQVYKKAKERVEQRQEQVDDFVRLRSVELGEMLVLDTSRYLTASWDKLHGKEPAMVGLEAQILDRWVTYLKDPPKDHSNLKPWYDMVSSRRQKAADRFIGASCGLEPRPAGCC